MSGGGFWTNMVTGEDDVAGLEDYSFPITQEIDEMSTKVQAVDVLVPPSGGAPHPRSTRPYSKRTKNFDLKVDEVVVAAWLT